MTRRRDRRPVPDPDRLNRVVYAVATVTLVVATLLVVGVALGVVPT